MDGRGINQAIRRPRRRKEKGECGGGRCGGGGGGGGGGGRGGEGVRKPDVRLERSAYCVCVCVCVLLST